MAWEILLHGTVIETVWFLKEITDAGYVRRCLINHDGFSPEIEVRRVA